jgi:hypothetical protein
MSARNPLTVILALLDVACILAAGMLMSLALRLDRLLLG